MKIPVTVVIAARNEAANIGACVESVSWAAEIFVVEDGSIDSTAENAEKAGAVVIRNAFQTIGLQRNAAIGRASSEWILVVDADERASPDMGPEIDAMVKRPRFDAYRVPRRNFFLGKEVRHGGWESDKPVRLFRSALRYNANRVHEHVDYAGETGELSSTLRHEPYATLDTWFDKLGRYSEWWAEDKFERGRRAGIVSVIVRPKLRFFTMYLIRGGFLDGARGALLAAMAAVSVFSKYARLWERSRR